MLWDIILGSLAAILLIIILALVVTGLTNTYQKLFEQRRWGKLQRPDLIPDLARFAAVATIVLLLVLSLLIGEAG
jgi:hypothetical protein